MCIAFGEDRPATSCDIPTVTTLDRGYAAATIADGELRLSVGPESILTTTTVADLYFDIASPGIPEKSSPALPIPSLHVRACAADDHPFACALLKEIHPDTLTAIVFSVPDPLFGDTAMGRGNIAEHLHVDRP
jgi:hypothetical protein